MKKYYLTDFRLNRIDYVVVAFMTFFLLTIKILTCPALFACPLSFLVESFNQGIGAETSCLMASEEYMDGFHTIEGMKEAVTSLVGTDGSAPAVAAAIEFILEGLHLSNKLNREVIEGRRRYAAAPPPKRKGRPVREPLDWDKN